MMWRSWKMMLLLLMMMSAEGVEAALPCTTSSRQRLRNGIPAVVWMHVFAWLVDILNIHFEHLTFCCVLLVSSILVYVNVIDINTCKVLIFILVWNVLLLCLRLSHGMIATQRTCGDKFLCQWLCHSLGKFCTKNYENPSIFVKVTAKKLVALFFLDTVWQFSLFFQIYSVSRTIEGASRMFCRDFETFWTYEINA